MLLFSPQNKLIFRDNKVQIIPEGKAASDCWCCDPGPTDNCYKCKDPDSENFDKKFYGGTTSVIGFPNTYEAPPHFGSLNPGSLFDCIQLPFINEISHRYIGLDVFNDSWTVQPASLTDCTNLNKYEKRVKITEEVYGIKRTNSPPYYCEEEYRILLFVYEHTYIYHMLYGWAYISPYPSPIPYLYRRQIYRNSACLEGAGVPENPPFLYGYFTFGGIFSSRSICETSSVDWNLFNSSPFCNEPDLNVNITSIPNFLP